MRRQIEPACPLVTSVVHSSSGLPSNFTYTSFAFIRPGKLFLSPSFAIKNLLAAGTFEGPIILFTADTSLKPVCLLVGHFAEVTDIIVSLQRNTYLSVSSDGTICGWHAEDATCRFCFKNIIPPGQHKFSYHLLDPSLIWVWTRGSCIRLLDLKTGQTKITILFTGLLSFSIQSGEHGNQFAICVGIGRIKIFEISESNTVTVKELRAIDQDNETHVVTLFGLIHLSKNRWSIERYPDILITHSESKSITEGDEFVDAIWNDSLCLCSRFSTFVIVNYDQTDKITKTQVIRFNTFYSTIFAFSGESGLCLSPDQLKIRYHNLKREIPCSVPPTSNLAVVPDPNEPIVFQSDSHRTVSLFNWEHLPKSTQHFKIRRGRVKSVLSFSIQRPLHRLVLLIGDSYGTLSFFWVSSGELLAEVPCLTCPIIGLAPIGGKTGQSPILAIGKSGDCVLLNFSQIVRIFSGNGIPCRAVYQSANLDLLVMSLLDESFIVYSIDQSEILEILFECPPNYTKIWPQTDIAVQTSSTNCLRFGDSSVFFHVVESTKLSNCLHEYLSISSTLYQLLAPFTHSKSMGFHGASPPRSNSFSQFKDIACSMNPSLIDHLSFVLIGSLNLPTFFYPMYRLTANSILDTSPFIAATYYLSKYILETAMGDNIHKLYNVEAIISFLPIMTQMVFTENRKVQEVSIRIIADVMGSITIQQCEVMITKYVSQFKTGISELENFDKLLLSIIAISHSSFINQEYLPLLFAFIQQLALTGEGHWAMGVVLLLDGYDLWSEIGDPMLSILQPMISHPSLEYVDQIFAITAGAHVDMFLKITRTNLGANIDDKVAQRLIQLNEAVAFTSMATCCASILLNLLVIETDADRFDLLIDTTVKKLCKKCKSADMFGDTVLVGCPTGTVHAFRGKTHLFSEKMFNSQINLVSLGPDKKYGCAVCRGEQKMVVFKVANTLLSKTKIIAEMNVSDKQRTIEWKDNSICCLI